MKIVRTESAVPQPAMSRRRFLASAGATALTAAFLPRNAFAGCDLTSSDILGPYHVPDAPFRTVLASADEPGTRLFISGRVLASDCATPIQGAIVDVWHARDDGCYSVVHNCPDEDPFNCRGQMLTNGSGDYAYETILPGYYAGRPKHVHYIVSPPEGPSLTTQLYFEIDPESEGQSPDLIIPLEMIDGAWHGVFDVKLLVVPSAVDEEHSLPTAVRLHQNFPNPFRAETSIRYQLRLETAVVLDVFTAGGRVVRRLVHERQGPGYYTVAWDGLDDDRRETAAGTYLCRLTAGRVADVRKMLRLR